MDSKIRVRCSGATAILGATMLLILPLKWVIAMIIAIAIHELFHCVAIQVTGNHICEISITQHGMVIQTTPLSQFEELFCAAFGPLGSILLFLGYPWIPRIALCAGVQGIFNLLPVYPLDGGRIFRVLVQKIFPEYAECIFKRTEFLLIVTILAAGIYFSVYIKLGYGPIFLSALFLFRVLIEKYLAKRGN